MSSAKRGGIKKFVVRLALAVALAAPIAGCFQPMYADHNDASPILRDKLTAIEVQPLEISNGSHNSRLGVELRNKLMFKLYGGATGAPPLYTLKISISTSRSSLIVDHSTQLPTIENYAIDASYQLKDNATGKMLMRGNTFSSVEYDVPGQSQRFARTRAGRDSEDRAVEEIAENINSRLASFFYAGM